MESVKVSVPGKIHLMGEHAIVYGKPALLAAINRRLYVTVSENKKLEIKTSEGNYLIKKAVEVVTKKLRLKSPPKVKIEIKSEIPTGRHIGSSAAVSVGTVAALMYYLKNIWDLNLFNDLAYEVEKVQHGNPSGGDNSTVCFGGLIFFQKISEDKKVIKRLPFTIPEKIAKNYVIIDTGKPKESTGEMVKSVAKFVKKYPKKAKKLLDKNEKTTNEVIKAIKEGNENLLISAIKKGEKTLEGLSVVSKYVSSIVQTIELSGGAAKICGGGGKKKGTGIVLTYHKNKKIIEKIAHSCNLNYYDVKLGVKGLRKE